MRFNHPIGTWPAQVNAIQKINPFYPLRRKIENSVRYLDQATPRQYPDSRPRGNRPPKATVSLKNNESHAPHHDPARARRQGPVLSTLLESAKNISLALIFSTLCLAQGSLQIYQATGPTSQVFNNSNPKYNAWTVMYSYSGSGSFSIELDCAPDATTAGGTPTAGTYTACTPTTGSNPSTTPQYGYTTFVGYQTSLGSAPWIKLNLTAISGGGNLTAFAMGFTAADPESGSGGGGSGCPGSLSSPCVIAGTNGTAQKIIVGTIQAAVSLTTTTDVVLVAGTSGKTSYVPKFDMSWDNSADVTVRQGNGTTCLSSTTALAGPYKSLVALFEDYGAVAPLHTTTAGLDLCLHFSTSVTGGGQSFAAQF